MTNKDARKLKRAELLELLIGQTEENQRLTERNAQLEQQLSQRLIALEQAGSIAQAALELSGVFTQAQDAADRYLLTIADRQQQAEKALDEAKQQAQGLPLYYTEWNANAIFSAWTNDTRKVAAYDVKTALDVAEDVTGSSIWCFSDIFEELHPFVQEFHGGFGMLTQHGIPKPVYYAMKLLADAPDTRIDLGPDATDGEIGVAAFEGGGETHVVLFRQKMKNLDLPAEEAVIRLPMADRPGRVTLRRIDESHGNPLRLWQEMGSPEQLTPAQVEDIRTRSAVAEEEWPFTWEDGVLTLRAALRVNDVYGFVIREA